MSAFGGKADSLAYPSERLLLANNGHSLVSKSGPLKGRNRPNPAIQGRCRERRLSDRKADIAYEEIIVRRGNRFACPLS